ncbi:hypothetical protein ACEYYH_02410 [Microbacterium trichothecenolyticum]|uniref:phosphotriesterase family protein n=1 Tax=Microbacterium trichothecenolyticum TaxID=69370 RepID=UPI0035BE1C43
MIETVLGPISADALGATCMHDHLRVDASGLRRDGATPAPDHDDVRLETLGYLRWNMLSSADNLRLNDDDLAARELSLAAVLGQRAVVECSSIGLGPTHASLPAISRASGVAVISAYGFYVPYALPGWVGELDEEQLESHLFEALTVAVPGTSFRAGLLGIMGTTAQFAPREREMLRAASRAGARTGASVSVRLDPEAARGVEVVELMTAEGLPADRIIFTNADEYMDAGYWAELADAGAVLEMCFGTEAVHPGRVDNPSDRERLSFFGRFAGDHPQARHVLGLSTWTKAQLAAYGGYGYSYLLARIVPELAERGIAADRLDAMLVDEPRRLLDRVVPGL